MLLIPAVEKSIRWEEIALSLKSHSEIPGGRITISNWGQGKSQWMAALFFWPSGWTPISISGFWLIVPQWTVNIHVRAESTLDNWASDLYHSSSSQPLKLCQSACTISWQGRDPLLGTLVYMCMIRAFTWSFKSFVSLFYSRHEVNHGTPFWNMDKSWYPAAIFLWCLFWIIIH